MNFLFYLPAAIGILFIAVGIFHGYRLRSLTRKCSVATKGTVISFKKKKMKSGELLFPVITYMAGNQKIMAQYGIGNAEWKIKRGDKVDLRYNPSNFAQIYLYHEQNIFQQYASPFFVIVGGLLFLLAYVKLS